jgi:hypothetical protein
MREFAAASGRVTTLSLPARILYTVFALLTLAGAVSCVVLYDDIVRFDARATPDQLRGRLAAHYEGVSGDGASGGGASGDGTSGDGASGDGAGRGGMSRQRLVETTHAHLFTMPVLLLVAGHLFLLARTSMTAKLAVVIVASAATTLHLFAPWLVVWTHGHALAAAFYALSGGLLLLVTAVMLIVPVWQMWRPATS